MDELTEYRRHRKRIQTEISRLRKKGYTVDIKLPPVIKDAGDWVKLDSALYYVRGITNQSIRLNAIREVSTGEYISYEEEKLKRSRRKADRQRLYDLYESNWFNMIHQFPAVAEPYLTSVTQNLISKIGREAFYEGVNTALSDGYILTYEQAYDLESLYDYASGLTNYFNYQGEDFENMMEAISTDDIFAEMFG